MTKVGGNLCWASQVAKLEAVADEVVNLESRLEAAEEERNAAVQKARVFTPRPEPYFDDSAVQLNEQATSWLRRMIKEFRHVLMGSSIWRFVSRLVQSSKADFDNEDLTMKIGP